jgi:hydroxyacylglutathione hydrolase
MLFRQIFDPGLAQYAYLIGCQKTKEALVIDPERDIDRYVEAAEAEGLRIVAVAETHIHADFLSGAREFAERYGVRVYVSDEGDADWKYEWVRGRKQDGAPYEYVLLRDGDAFRVGGIRIQAVHTPGHTPEHLSFLVTDLGGGATTPIGIVTGDFVFVGDLGRPDLLEQAAGLHGVQEPSARRLYASLPRFTALEDHLQVWPAHGAGSACGKALGAVPQTTVGYEKRYNASLGAAQHGEAAFVQAILSGQPEPQLYFARMKRDNKLGAPVLGGLPQPRKLTAAELGRLAAREDVVVVDTRLDRSGFMAKHLPGALYAPMNRTFSTVVGSLVADERAPLVLVTGEEHVEAAVRDLVRIGYDHVVAYATPETLETYFEDGGTAASITEIDFDAVERLRARPDVAVVDVRFRSEYAAGHVPGAVNASYTRLPAYEQDRIPGGKTLLVHCASGARSAAAAAYLARRGYDVRYVSDSFDRYRKAGTVEAGEAVPA